MYICVDMYLSMYIVYMLCDVIAKIQHNGTCYMYKEKRISEENIFDRSDNLTRITIT